MQNVSQTWKENQTKTLVNESFVEISLDIADPDALADASSEDNGAIYISNTSQVVSEVDKSIIPYFTLEQNLWILDGKRKAIPLSDFGDCGFIGDVLSGNDCAFSDEAPIVTVNFTKVHSNIIPAITITWGSAYGEFAEDFVITAYNGDTVVAEKEVIGNKEVRSVVEFDIVDYDCITIKILRWCLPCRRARIEEIFIGMNKIYFKSDIFSYRHTQTVNPISTSLPKAEVSFSIDNTDNSYNPYNTNGLSKYLMERQEIKTRYGYKLDDGNEEWIKGGTFYLSEWDAAQNGMKADFTARDLLEFMSATFYEGLYNEDGVSLYSLALQLLEKAELPLNSNGTVKWILDSSLKNIYTTAPLPIDTISNNLQLIANAAGCVLYQDREGTLHIEPIDSINKNIAITFNSQCAGESNVYDYLYLYYIQNGKIFKVLDKVRANNIAGKTIVIPTLDFYLWWHTDSSSNNYYGFSIDSVELTTDIAEKGTEISSLPSYTVIETTDITQVESKHNPYDNNSNLFWHYIKIPVTDYAITLENSFSKSDIILSKPLKQVNVATYQYFEDGGITDLYKGVLSLSGTAELWISYSDMALSANAIVTGGTLDSAVYYTNACKLTITANGSVTVLIEGVILKSSKTEVIISSGAVGETITVDNPLVTDRSRASVLGVWMEKYLKNRMTLTSSWRADPRLDALDIINNVNEYNTNNVRMTEVVYDYNGAFHGTGEGRVI